MKFELRNITRIVFGVAEIARRAAFEASVAAVGGLDGAKAGDRTMLDALFPACDAWRDGMWRQAVQAVETGARQTADMYPRIGRAFRQGDRAKGSPDAGAVAAAVWMGAMGEAFG